MDKNKRVLLETAGNVVFAGAYRGEFVVGETEGVMIETDEKTQVSIWCPKSSVKRLTIIDIQEGEEEYER